MSTAQAPVKLLKFSEVCARANVGRTTIYRWMKEGKFPEPMRLGAACNRWDEAELDRWLLQKAKAGEREPRAD